VLHFQGSGKGHTSRNYEVMYYDTHKIELLSMLEGDALRVIKIDRYTGAFEASVEQKNGKKTVFTGTCKPATRKF